MRRSACASEVTSPLAKGDADYIDGRFLGAGFDLLRVADNILRREDE
jgi:hypothetical protein